MKRVGRTAVLVGAVSVVGYRTVVRPWHERWGATDDEVNAPLPGDELVAEPTSQTTRAITIEAAPDDVWPWILQILGDLVYANGTGTGGGTSWRGRTARRVSWSASGPVSATRSPRS